MHERLRYIPLAAFFAALTAVGAQIRVPLFPVPFTLQTFFVVLSGSLLGPAWGAASMIIYIVLGLMGLPVFAGAAGVAVVASPTFGYLLGFPLCAYWIGSRIRKSAPAESSWRAIFLIQLEGQAWVFLPGVAYLWLASRLFLEQALTIPQAVLVGFLPFLPGAALKTLAASWVTVRLKKLLNQGIG